MSTPEHPRGFLGAVEAAKRDGTWPWPDKPPAPRHAPVNGTPRAPAGTTAYAARALTGELQAVRAALPGRRNHQLNTSAFNLGQLVAAGHLHRDHVAAALYAGAEANGLLADDGERSVRATITSGLRAGEQQPRAVPDLTAPAVTVLQAPPIEQAAVEAFWSARPDLTRIHDFARARMCAPWAVLGCCLARVVVGVPPFVTLPPLVGSEASLNLFVALVGPSGGGKGTADAAAGDCLDVGHVHVAHIGSGEGIAHLYAHREKGAVVRDRQAVLFTVPEVDNLTALAGRQGATLLPQLRQAWSGEGLGFAYADPAKNLPLDRHSYRLGLILGVQPGRASALLDDADGGTPQRFLWLPATDPDMPEVAPEEPEPIRWSAPAGPWLYNVRGLHNLDVPEQAKAEVLAARRATMRGRGHTLDGHALLARLKVAAALALLDGRANLDEADWQLAGTVMAISDHTRATVARQLAAKAREANVARGEAEATRALVVTERLDDARVRRVCDVILRGMRAGEPGGWQTRRDLAHMVTSRDRAAVDEALARLVDANQVAVSTDTGKRLYGLPERS